MDTGRFPCDDDVGMAASRIRATGLPKEPGSIPDTCDDIRQYLLLPPSGVLRFGLIDDKLKL